MFSLFFVHKNSAWPCTNKRITKGTTKEGEIGSIRKTN